MHHKHHHAEQQAQNGNLETDFHAEENGNQSHARYELIVFNLQYSKKLMVGCKCLLCTDKMSLHNGIKLSLLENSWGCYQYDRTLEFSWQM